MGSKSKERLLVDEIEKFLSSNQRNQWINMPCFKFYLRKANRCIGGKMVSTLDLASIEICEQQRRKGIGTEVAEFCHFLNPFDVTFIENVSHASWSLRLRRNEWQLDERSVNLEFMTADSSDCTELGFETLYTEKKVPCGYIFPGGEIIPNTACWYKVKGENVFDYPFCRLTTERLKADRKSQGWHFRYYDTGRHLTFLHEFRLRGLTGKGKL